VGNGEKKEGGHFGTPHGRFFFSMRISSRPGRHNDIVGLIYYKCQCFQFLCWEGVSNGNVKIFDNNIVPFRESIIVAWRCRYKSIGNC